MGNASAEAAMMAAGETEAKGAKAAAKASKAAAAAGMRPPRPVDWAAAGAAGAAEDSQMGNASVEEAMTAAGGAAEMVR